MQSIRFEKRNYKLVQIFYIDLWVEYNKEDYTDFFISENKKHSAIVHAK